jgi:hypothetical protein
MIEDLRTREENRAARFKLRSILIQELTVKLGSYVFSPFSWINCKNRRYKKEIPRHVDNLLSRKRNITQEDVAELERLIRGGSETRPATTTRLPPANLDLTVSLFLISFSDSLIADPKFSKSKFSAAFTRSKSDELFK